MNRSYKIIPVYTGDVSGVCSALYELGGMVVIHDPSGCNSTYNTHDETRWYDQDSLIYITGLSHIDAIMGNDEKYVRDITAAANTLKPGFIALISSPVPYINGTDFQALAKLIEKRTGIKTFYIRTNGMHDYTAGAGEALNEVVKQFIKKEEKDSQAGSINILGMTPLDFAKETSVNSLITKVKAHGWQKIQCFAMGSTLEELKEAGNAQVSLVVSSVGLKAAKTLQEQFGIPYVIGTPVKGLEEEVFSALERAVREKVSINACKDVRNGASQAVDKGICKDTNKAVSRAMCRIDIYEDCIYLVGEPVIMGSIAAAIQKMTGRATCVLCPLEQNAEELFLDTDRIVTGEEAAEQILQEAETILADPLYRPICKEQAQFIEIPHLAFSGRCFRTRFPDVFEEEYYEQLK